MIRILHRMSSLLMIAAGVLFALAIRDHLTHADQPVGLATLSVSPPSDGDDSTRSAFYRLGLDGNRRGPDDAEVTIVVFSSYGCSHCASYERTLEALLRRYPDQLAIVTKHFAPTSRRVSLDVEAAADCAADQGKFNEYHREYFLTGQRTISREPWMGIGRRIGIADSAAFVNCVRSGKHASDVATQTAEAKALGVNATPTSFVNGVMIVGDVPFPMMNEIMGKALRGRLSTEVERQAGPATQS